MAEEKLTILDIAKEREEAGMAITRQWIGLWQQSLRYFLSDQLQGYKPSEKWDWVVLNYIWPSVMQEMSKLSRSFRIIANAIEPEDKDVAEAVQGFLQWQWSSRGGLHRHGMRIEQLKAILCGKLYGYRISKILWEERVRWNSRVFPPRWEGQVRHKLWRPSQFWASDEEYINDGDCGTVRYIELEYAQTLWSDFKTALEDDSVSYDDMIKEGGGDTISGQTAASGTYPAAGTGGQDMGPDYTANKGLNLLNLVMQAEGGSRSGTNETHRRFCKISEEYLKDYTEDKKKEDIPVDKQKLLDSGTIHPGINGEFLDAENRPVEDWPTDHYEWDEPRYPNGRYIIRNCDTILNPDEKEQVYPHSVWPFIITPHYLLPFMWQGSDAVTLNRLTQDHINVTVSHLVNNMKKFGDPRIAVEQDAIVTPPGRHAGKKFSIQRGAGAIIKLARGGLKKFQIIQPVPPSPATMMLYQLFAQEYKNLIGLQDIAMGKKSEGKITATEAQFLAMSSNDRIKLQNIFEEQWVWEIANLTLEMDQFYYETGRIVRVIGEDKIIGAKQITDRSKEADFDVEIQSTEGFAYDEDKDIEKHKIAYEILDRPILNPMAPEMLRLLGIHSWQKILERHEGWSMFVQFEQLIKAVQKGEIEPQDALRMLVEQATQRLMAMKGENQNGGNGNAQG